MVSKEIVNVRDGGRIGLVGEGELWLDETTGAIDAIALAERSGVFRSAGALVIPFTAIRKVGADLVIVDLARPQGS